MCIMHLSWLCAPCLSPSVSSLDFFKKNFFFVKVFDRDSMNEMRHQGEVGSEEAAAEPSFMREQDL